MILSILTVKLLSLLPDCFVMTRRWNTTLTAQILAKIVFYNLLPKSGEYSHARGCAPLLIYCLLKGIIVNIPKIIIDFMFSKHLMIPGRNLLYGMIITQVLKYFMFPTRIPFLLQLTFIAPFSKGCKLALVRMSNPLQFSFHHNLPLVPSFHLHIHTLLSWTKWTSCLWVTLPPHRTGKPGRVSKHNYLRSSQRYYQACVDYSFAQNEWPQLMPSGYTRSLSSDGPTFEPWVVPTELLGVYCPVVDAPDDPLYAADKDFIPSDDAQKWVIPFPPFWCWQKGEEKAGDMEILELFWLCFALCLVLGLVIIWICDVFTFSTLFMWWFYVMVYVIRCGDLLIFAFSLSYLDQFYLVYKTQTLVPNRREKT